MVLAKRFLLPGVLAVALALTILAALILGSLGMSRLLLRGLELAAILELGGLLFATMRAAPAGRRFAAAVAALALALLLLAGGFGWLNTNPRVIDTYMQNLVHDRALHATSQPGWHSRETGSFVLWYPEGTSLQEVEAVLPEAAARVKGAFGETPARLMVFVFPDTATAQAVLGNWFPPDFTGGAIADILFVRSPAAWSEEQRANMDLEGIVAHELTHSTAKALAGPAIPKWLTEGLAVYVAGQHTPEAQAKLAALAAAEKLESIAQIERAFHRARLAAQMGQAFAESGSLVAYMVEQYGFDRVQQVLTELGAGRDIDQALRAALGTDQRGLEAAWRQSLNGRP